MDSPRKTTHELVYHIGRGNFPPAEIPQVLSTIFDARDYKYCIQQLSEKDLGMWVEHLDQVCRLSPSPRECFNHAHTCCQIIDSMIFPEELRKRTLRALRKTCGLRRILPRSHYFRGRLHKTGNRPVSGGGTADVWRVEDDRRRLYAAKAFRVNFNGEDYKIKVSFSLFEHKQTTHFHYRGSSRKLPSGNG